MEGMASCLEVIWIEPLHSNDLRVMQMMQTLAVHIDVDTKADCNSETVKVDLLACQEALWGHISRLLGSCLVFLGAAAQTCLQKGGRLGLCACRQIYPCQQERAPEGPHSRAAESQGALHRCCQSRQLEAVNTL